jgi:magnesium and cobalt exporter, CNNM family
MSSTSATSARDAMTPRGDIVALDERTSVEAAARECLSSGVTRLPVYRGTLDQIVGMLHAKDLVRLCLDQTMLTPSAIAPRTAEGGAEVAAGDAARGPLAPLLRSATFVLEQQHLGDVLTTFRQEAAQLALVVDEYGQIAGLLTLEDVLEELVGEIQDEYDVGEEAPIVQRPDGRWLVAGTESYENVRAVAGLPPMPEEEHGRYTTLPGLVMLRLGRVPQVGDRVLLDTDWEVEVTDMEGRSVTQLLLRHRAADAQGEVEGAAPGTPAER